MTGKVSIVGGAGRVGATTAYALQIGAAGGHSPSAKYPPYNASLRGACAEIVLVDAAAEAAQGEALDLTHGRAAVGYPLVWGQRPRLQDGPASQAAGAPPPRVRAGGYDAIAGSDIAVVAAGLRRRPEESRLELIGRNAALFRQIVASLRQVQLASDTILLVVTNPVDVLTYLAATELGWPATRAIGLGTVLDTLRFRSLLGERFDLDPSRVEALILGEHGDSMVPIFSALRYEGAPVSALPGYSEEAAREVFELTRKAGAECLRLKGGASYAVGLAVREVVSAVLQDTGAVLPVSTLQPSGDFEGVAFSMPTRVGRSGALGLAPLGLSEEERRGLRHSAEVLRETTAGLRRGAAGGHSPSAKYPPYN